MTQADDRTQLAHEYTELVTQLEAHLNTTTRDDEHHLARWQTLYTPEIKTAIKRRDSMTRNGTSPAHAIPTSSELRDWTAEAQQIPTPNQA